MSKKRFLIYFIKYVPLCIALIVISYIAVVVNEVALKVKEKQILSAVPQNKESVLEEGTIVKADHLSTYLSFTPAKKELFDTRNDENFDHKNGKIYIKKEVRLPGLYQNSCQRYKCFQHKVDFEGIPAPLWKGLIGIEDYRFLEHEGIDYKSILRALVADIKAMKLVQGGSTLTQQLAKNLFLSSEKKLERKIREIIYAVYLEYKFSKEQILTMYFNEVFWGAIGGIYIKGVHSAAIHYFDKSPKSLTDFEAAILIGLLKGPYYYHPINKTQRLKQRTLVVYDRLKTLNLVSQKDKSVWNENQWSDWVEKLKKKNKSSLLQSIYLTTKNSDMLFEPFEKFVFYETVSSTEKLLESRLVDTDIGIKFFTIDKKCTNSDCLESFYYYSKIQRDRNEAIFEEKHQVGSAIKPIIYEQFLKLGKSLDDKVSTKPISLKLNSGVWTPKDASKVKEDFVTLRHAIKKSKNIPLIRTAQEIGFDKLEDYLLEYFPGLLRPLSQYPAQLLGAIELSMADLSLAYLKYFSGICKNINEGKYTLEKSILYELSKASETTISNVANETIKQVMLFGKTGTTNSGLDNWYIAFDGKVFYAIWFGVDGDRKNKKLKLSGASSAFRIFQDFIEYRGKQIYELYCE